MIIALQLLSACAGLCQKANLSLYSHDILHAIIGAITAVDEAMLRMRNRGEIKRYADNMLKQIGYIVKRIQQCSIRF